MGNIDQRANGKKLRTEVTSIEQFNAIGTYGEIAKKYKVSTAMSHALKMSLQAKKLREEKEAVQEVVLECSEDEVLVDQGMTEEENMTDEEWEAQKKREWDTQREEWDALDQADHPENYEVNDGEREEPLSDEVINNKEHWEDQLINDILRDIEANSVRVRRMYVMRAERECEARLEKIVRGESA